MKLSVIIPCYNFENYIEQAVLSVLSQRTNFEFEILIRDDNSTDSSYDNIIRYNDTMTSGIVRLLDSSENLGGQRNIKKLMDNCRGEYIAYLDGDDYWVNTNKLQKQVEYMESNPECVMTFTGYWMKENGEYVPSDPNSWLCLHNYYENAEVTTEQLLDVNPGTFGRVFRNIEGLFKDWMFDCKFLDWAMNYEISKYGKIKYLDFPSGVYRAHGGGVLTSLSRGELEEETNNTRQILLNDYNNWIKNKN